MARNNSFWQRHKYKLNGLVLVLPFWFLYQSITPVFPPAWPAQQLGDAVEAEFHAADMRAHRLRPGERALEIDGVEGDENGIVGQRGHAGISRKQGKG